jgi:hypothetical protein
MKSASTVAAFAWQLARRDAGSGTARSTQLGQQALSAVTRPCSTISSATNLSGRPVRSTHELLGHEFTEVSSGLDTHHTPSGTAQQFLRIHFARADSTSQRRCGRECESTRRLSLAGGCVQLVAALALASGVGDLSCARQYEQGAARVALEVVRGTADDETSHWPVATRADH